MSQQNWSDTQRFDNKAADWDANALRAALADDVARATIAHMPVARPANALEFGCGTGLLTTRIAPHCTRLTALDSSAEMLRMLSEKISAGALMNIVPLQVDFSRPKATEELEGGFDFVCSSMTLHHIPDTTSFLRELAGHLVPGAMLSIADLDAEDGLFHDDDTEKVHYGFERQSLKQMLETAGFTNVAFITVHVIEKKNRAGNWASYPVFLVTAIKNHA
ncbi:MAG: class I SAM-dependent methyltransferase [Chlorobiaceae bacterium]|jgi:2-polyprenyl-3-methyl-5-hydroxy-6-metoxy-1,4-benzoquinol methylase|nr:class I SAM-dependent methyltransferase [Chlorobiaceae bacterium]